MFSIRLLFLLYLIAIARVEEVALYNILKGL